MVGIVKVNRNRKGGFPRAALFLFFFFFRGKSYSLSQTDRINVKVWPFPCLSTSKEALLEDYSLLVS